MKHKAKGILALAASLGLGGCAHRMQAVPETMTATRETLESIRLEMPESGKTEGSSGLRTGERQGNASGSGERGWIHPKGHSIGERIAAPEGYERVTLEEGSFGEFVRNYPLKEDGAPVMYYDGNVKASEHHVAVFDMYLGQRDLQQCADSVMRMIAEYYYAHGAYDKIHFEFVNGFDCSYARWRQGQRVKIEGNSATWTGGGEAGDSPENFERYLTTVFAYGSTLSMERDGSPVELSDIKAGDVFIKGGSPGHVVMVADVCEDAEGRKAFLLAQGYMPAQSFHVLKNPSREEPWYYEEDVTYPFITPEYTFLAGSLMRLGALN